VTNLSDIKTKPGCTRTPTS